MVDDPGSIGFTLHRLRRGFALNLAISVAAITAQFAVVVGRWQPTAHGQQKALTVATDAKREQNSRFVA